MVKRFGIALFAGIVGIGTLAYAQAQESQPATPDSTASTPTKQGHWKHHRQSSAQRVQRMSKKLNLNADQQSKVQSIMEDQQKQMQSLRQDKSLSRQDRGAKVADLRQNTSRQIRAVLNEDQQKKFDEMQQKRQKRMAAHHAK